MPKLDQILDTDYNTIRNKIVRLLGQGDGQYGYGQQAYITSGPVYDGNSITKLQWDQLRADLTNVKLHQDGVPPPLVSLTSGSVITYDAASPNTNYNTVADQATLSRFNVGTGRSAVTVVSSQTRTGSWTYQSRCTLTVAFTNGSNPARGTSADFARYFFNSGGKLRFTTSRSGGSTSNQNTAWTNLLTSVGTVEFGGITPTLRHFYNLTNSYTTVYQLGATSPYSANYFRIEALCNCVGTNNSDGSASEITFRFTWQDDYQDPDSLVSPPPSNPPADVVDGTLTIGVQEVKAGGAILPSGTFSIESPSYSITSISYS